MVTAEAGDDVPGDLEASGCTAVHAPAAHTPVPPFSIVTVSPMYIGGVGDGTKDNCLNSLLKIFTLR